MTPASNDDLQLAVSGLQKRFGGFVALSGVDFQAKRGERIGIIGPNGSGKSTFVNCLTGAMRHDAGEIRMNGQDIGGLPAHRRAWKGLSRTFQLPRPFGSLSVAENIYIPLLNCGAMDNGSRDISVRATAALELVGLADKADALPKELTQVELRKLELAKTIATDPQILVSDEAMAGLSHSEVDEILALLLEINSRGTTVVMIEHIIRAVMRFSQRLVVFVAGEKIADGDPQAVMAMPEVERAYLGQ
ncbi:ABC transporter ATP-binding protein [Ferrovibrio sp.]|uniref:ABC transporter ATP-binding protein n=1 Tax=Ferrovibrio sp. TaxID=1917215 RepID=UPI00311F7CDD